MNPLKHLLTTLLLLTATLLPAQTYDLSYTLKTYPFKWEINKIKGTEGGSTYIYLTLKNTSNYSQSINFTDGAYAIPIFKSDSKISKRDSKKPVEATYNSVSRSGKSKFKLKPHEELPITLKFPTLSILRWDSFNLQIANNHILRNINIITPSFVDIEHTIPSWEEYYNANRKVIPTYNSESELRQGIINEVEAWQKKGEFESTAAWKLRVTEKSIEEYTLKITNQFLSGIQNERNLIEMEQITLAKDYERYKEDILYQFYQQKIAKAEKEFTEVDFNLWPYDADNQTFMIHSNAYGDVLLPVPLAEAPSFKQNWENIKRNITPEFVPNGEDVALTKLVFTNNGKEFVYDSHTEAKYAITDVKYNFAPLEIAEIDVANLKFDNLPDIPKDVASTVVGKTSADVLTVKTAQVDRKTVSATDRSDVDTAIPVNSKLKNPTTFAVIIANENYTNVSPVPFAENDGKVFAKYLNQSLGLPQEHIKTYYNATYGNIAAALKHIQNLSTAYGDKLNLILYYAGHGVPNERTKGCMLLPTDGDAQIPETCFQVDKLYETLEKLNANSTIVLMDACFSGSVRGDGMLYASRGIKIKSNLDAPKGNMVIISASQGDETAYPLEKERHGLFTFNLLKYLQEKKGNVNLSDLSNYIVEQVKRQSVVYNGKLQTPMVQYSPAIESEWRSWPLVQ